jgi:hypothetical protein
MSYDSRVRPVFQRRHDNCLACAVATLTGHDEDELPTAADGHICGLNDALRPLGKKLVTTPLSAPVEVWRGEPTGSGVLCVGVGYVGNGLTHAIVVEANRHAPHVLVHDPDAAARRPSFVIDSVMTLVPLSVDAKALDGRDTTCWKCLVQEHDRTEEPFADRVRAWRQ